MLKLSVKFDVNLARQQMKGFEREVNKAAAVSINRVMTTLRVEASKDIRERLNVKSTVVKTNLRITRPYGPSVLIRDLESLGKPIPLRDFAARDTQKGVTYKVKRGGPRKRYTRLQQRGFIVERLGQHVFVRKGAEPPGPPKIGMKKVYGPSIPQYFVTRFVRERLIRLAYERWHIEFEREITFRRGRLGII